jgi:hypothetical protein
MVEDAGEHLKELFSQHHSAGTVVDTSIQSSSIGSISSRGCTFGGAGCACSRLNVKHRHTQIE